MATAKPVDNREERWRKYIPLLYKEIKPIEIELIVDLCKELDLDPVLGELVSFRGRPYITEVGLMKIANRSGDLDGMNVTSEFADPDGRGQRWIATVTIYKKNCSHPFVFSADQLEYQNPSSGVWQKNKRSMTEKCCTCKTVRHAFEVSLPSIEEMAIDEYGATAEESQTQARVDAKTEAAEAKAEEHSARKEEAKEARKAEKAARITVEQTQQIGALYNQIGLPRIGENSTEALFRKNFPKETYPELKNEQFLSTQQASEYICKLWKILGQDMQHRMELDTKTVKETLAKTLPNRKISEITTEEWPVYIAALKWAGVDKLYRLLKYDESTAVDMFNARFPQATSRTDVSEAELDAYIAELRTKLAEAENPTEPASNDAGEQVGLFGEEAA